jgi:hypothetical protein
LKNALTFWGGGEGGFNAKAQRRQGADRSSCPGVLVVNRFPKPIQTYSKHKKNKKNVCRHHSERLSILSKESVSIRAIRLFAPSREVGKKGRNCETNPISFKTYCPPNTNNEKISLLTKSKSYDEQVRASKCEL